MCVNSIFLNKLWKKLVIFLTSKSFPTHNGVQIKFTCIRYHQLVFKTGKSKCRRFLNRNHAVQGGFWRFWEKLEPTIVIPRFPSFSGPARFFSFRWSIVNARIRASFALPTRLRMRCNFANSLVSFGSSFTLPYFARLVRWERRGRFSHLLFLFPLS